MTTYLHIRFLLNNSDTFSCIFFSHLSPKTSSTEFTGKQNDTNSNLRAVSDAETTGPWWRLTQQSLGGVSLSERGRPAREPSPDPVQPWMRAWAGCFCSTEDPLGPQQRQSLSENYIQIITDSGLIDMNAALGREAPADLLKGILTQFIFLTQRLDF